MKPLTPAMHARLTAASTFVLDALAAGQDAATIIFALERNHAAKLQLRPCGNVLSCAGIRASCTWSQDAPLLNAWRSRAVVALASQP